MLTKLIGRISSLEQELIELREELESNRSFAANVIRLGVVAAASDTTVDVTTGDNKATGVPFFVHCAGRVAHYRRPSVGEQCVLLNLGSGDNLNNAVALMGLPSTQYPTPSTKATEVVTDYGGGMRESYDLESGKLTAIYPAGVEITGGLKVHGEIADSVRAMSKDREIYNSHTHAETQAVTKPTEQTQ